MRATQFTLALFHPELNGRTSAGRLLLPGDHHCVLVFFATLMPARGTCANLGGTGIMQEKQD